MTTTSKTIRLRRLGKNRYGRSQYETQDRRFLITRREYQLPLASVAWEIEERAPLVGRKAARVVGRDWDTLAEAREEVAYILAVEAGEES